MILRAAGRPATRAMLVLAVALLIAIGAAGPAAAHAVLIGSDPADGAVLPVAPSVVTLTFDDAVKNFEPILTVTGPDGNQYQTGAATVDGAKLSTTVGPLPVAGDYAIAYRVVSNDGHPVQGQIHFALAPSGVTGSASPPATTAGPINTSPINTSPINTTSAPTVSTGSDPAESSSSGSSVWPWLLAVVAVAVAGAAVVVVRRRRSPGR